MQLDTVDGANRSLAILQPFGDYEALWRRARACAWLAEDYADNKTRGQLAERGMEYAKRAVAREPNRIEGHYYLAQNALLSGSTKSWSWLTMIPQVRDEALAAAKIDEKYDHAGPLRLLGVLYATIPGWPASVGDPTLAIQYLQRALQIDPDYPENHLRMAQALKADEQQYSQESLKVQSAPSKPEYAHRLVRWQREAP